MIDPEVETLSRELTESLGGAPVEPAWSTRLGIDPCSPTEQDRELLRELATRARAFMRANPSGPDAYEDLHWGIGSTGTIELDVPDPNADGPLVVLGELVEVTYRTRKGRDDRPVDYVHKFGRKRPILIVNARGRLLIGGGSYTVRREGITG